MRRGARARQLIRSLPSSAFRLLQLPRALRPHATRHKGPSADSLTSVFCPLHCGQVTRYNPPRCRLSSFSIQVAHPSMRSLNSKTMAFRFCDAFRDFRSSYLPIASPHRTPPSLPLRGQVTVLTATTVTSNCNNSLKRFDSSLYTVYRYSLSRSD